MGTSPSRPSLGADWHAGFFFLAVRGECVEKLKGVNNAKVKLNSDCFQESFSDSA